jgi:hypothetical protein
MGRRFESCRGHSAKACEGVQTVQKRGLRP